MKGFLLVSVLCGALVTASPHAGERHHVHRHHNRQADPEPTTTVTDYVEVDETITLSGPAPSDPPIKAEQKFAVPPWNGGNQWSHDWPGYSQSASTSSAVDMPASSSIPSSSALSFSSSATAAPVAVSPSSPASSPKTSAQQSPTAAPISSASAQASPASSSAVASSAAAVVQSSGGHIVASISSISSPTSAVLSATSIIGKVCTATVSQLPDYFADVTVQSHNVHRNNHSSVPIQWDNNLASYAASWASYCNFSHNSHFGGGYGQNIAAGQSPADISKVITDQFYNGEVSEYAPYYGIANPTFPSNAAPLHFSQVVWNSTTRVGCATIDCSSCGVWMNSTNSYAPKDMGAYMTVCNYGIAGNMAGQYANNVFKSSGQATVYGTTASG